VRNTESSLRSSISQQADRISLVVQGTGSDATIKTASIVAGINNQDGSFVKIQAAKINLSGYVTASQLTSVDGRIDNLVSGNTQASAISTNRLYASNFQFGGKTIRRESATIGGITYQILTWS
jgi:phage gpG-like protein